MSYFAPRFGFVCDNVENFEVVLASGRIVDANSSSNQDLWFALKGGSNNFGIVTRFDFKVFPQGDVWGGNIFNPIETRKQQIQAFYSINAASDYDEYASLINSYAYSAAAGGLVIANTIVYTKPEAYPKTFAPLTDIRPQILNTMEIANLSTIVTNEGRFQPSGQRYENTTPQSLKNQIAHSFFLQVNCTLLERTRMMPTSSTKRSTFSTPRFPKSPPPKALRIRLYSKPFRGPSPASRSPPAATLLALRNPRSLLSSCSLMLSGPTRSTTIVSVKYRTRCSRRSTSKHTRRILRIAGYT